MEKIKLVCFDLDDTLTRDIHSVMFLCMLNGNYEQLLEIEKREMNDEFNWIEADYHKAALLKGLDESEISKKFDDILKPLKNISSVVNALHQNEIQSILITAGPTQVAKAAKEKWGFDDYYGSNYETENGIFTGKILEHLGDAGKVACLKNYCAKHNIHSSECIAVGDGASDIPLFEYCRASIAINYSPSVKGKATNYLQTDDLFDIMRYIV